MRAMPLSRKQAAPLIEAAFPEYNGRKIVLEFSETITLWDLNWSGGSKSTYVGMTMDAGKIDARRLTVGAPWLHGLEGHTVRIPHDGVVAVHTYSCGRDVGVRFVAHPSLAPRMLPAGA